MSGSPNSNRATQNTQNTDRDDEIAELFGDELPEYEEEEDGEDLFGDDMARCVCYFHKNCFNVRNLFSDYRPQPELDVLSGSGLDEDAYSEISAGARRAAEREMAERDNLLEDGQLFYEEGDDAPANVRRRRADMRNFIDDDDEDEAAVGAHVDVLEIQRDRAMRDHVKDEAVRKEIERRWVLFSPLIDLTTTIFCLQIQALFAPLQK